MRWGAWKPWSLWLLCLITASQHESLSSRIAEAAEEGGATSLKVLEEGNKGVIPSGQGSCGSGKGRRQLLSVPCRDVVVVGNLDGTISALDSDTGQHLWLFDSGSPLVSSGFSHGSEGQQVFPGVDGSLYVIKNSGDLKIERMSVTIPELVENSPSITADGSVIIGGQSAALYYLDLDTGKLMSSFSSGKSGVQNPEGQLGDTVEDQKLLLLGRQDFHVQSIDQMSGLVRWNVSYSHIQHLDVRALDSGIGISGFLQGKHVDDADELSGSQQYQIGAGGALHALDPATGWNKWSVSFDFPPVFLHSPSTAGEYVGTSMKALTPWSPPPPQAVLSGQTPVAAWGNSAHLRPKGVKSRVPWGNAFRKDPNFMSRVIVGSMAGGLYALPAPQWETSEPKTGSLVPIPGNHLMEVQDADGGEVDALSCVLGVQDLKSINDQVPWLPSTPTAKAHGKDLESMGTYLAGFVSLLVGGLAFWFLQKRNQAPKPIEEPFREPVKQADVTSMKPKEVSLPLEKESPEEPFSPMSIATSINAVPPSTALFSNEPSHISLASTFSTKLGKDDGSTEVGQLSIGPGILGYGTAGTVVFEGVFHGRPVAVKRLLKQFYDLAANEKDILILSDENPNLIRLYAMEEDKQFVYLALERCQTSLASLMASAEGRKMLIDSKGKPTPQCITIIQDIANGLDALHARGVVHRDVKPHNVLLTENCRAKLSDMGLGRRLVADQSSFYSIGSGGSSGWQAPEQLIIRDGGAARQSKTMDVFSLGCVMYYCLTGGGHPFGNSSYERDANILRGDSFLRPLKNIPEALHLIRDMLQVDPRKRPLMKRVLAHPFWWNPGQRLQFLVDLSDRVENEDRRDDKSLISAFERCATQATGGNWGARLDPLLVSNLGHYRKYNFTSLKDLLRVIRNKHNHFREMPTELRELLSPQPDGFLWYFTSRFPDLLLTTYLFSRDYLSGESPLNKYFPDRKAEKQKSEADNLVEHMPSLDEEGCVATSMTRETDKTKEIVDADDDQGNDGFTMVKSRVRGDGWRSLRVKTGSVPGNSTQHTSVPPARTLNRKAQTGTGWDSVFDIIRENAYPQPASLASPARKPVVDLTKRDWTEKAELHTTKMWNGVPVPDGFFSSPSSSSAENSASSLAERRDSGYAKSGTSTPRVQETHPRGFDALVLESRRSTASSTIRSEEDPYKELQSPVKLSEGIRRYERPDKPIVGWEQSDDNIVHTVLRFPQRPGMQLCDFYMKTGFCKYHERCKFDHPLEFAIRLNEDGLPMRPGEPVCEYYKSTHACKFGGACKFHHPNMQPIYAGSEELTSPIIQ